MLSSMFKKPYKADLKKPLTNYVKTCLKDKDLTDAIEMINNIDSMRQAAVFSNDFQQLANYYTYLLPILSHFPVCSEKNSLSLKIYWYDAITGKGGYYNNLKYELCAILYNMGMSHFSNALPLIKVGASGDNCFQAAKYFKDAGIFFKYLRESKISDIQNNVSFDLTVDGVLICEKLCIALGQYAFTQKFASGNCKMQTLSELYAGCTKCFSDVYDLCYKHRDCIPSKMIDEIQTYIYYCAYSSSYCYYQQYLVPARKYEPGAGQAVGYIKSCRESINKALQYARNCNSPRCPEFLTLSTQVEANYKEAVNLNTTFHETTDVNIIPRENIVFKLDGVPNLPESQHIFENLIPREVEDKLNKYLDTVANPTLNEYKTEYNRMNDIIDTTFKDLKIDALVQSNSGESGVPSDVWSQLQSIQQQGGVESLRIRNENMQDVYRICQNDFADAKNRVSQFSSYVMSLTQNGVQLPNDDKGMFESMISELEQALTQTENGLNEVNRLYSTVASTNKIFTTSKEELSSMMPSSAGRDHSREFSTVEELYNNINQLKDKRAHLIASFETSCSDTIKITTELMRDPNGIDTEGIYKRGKMQLDNMYEQIKMTYDIQNDFISQLKSAVDTYTSKSSVSSDLNKTSSYLEAINNAIADYNQLNKYLNEGENCLLPIRNKIQSIKESVAATTQNYQNQYGFGGSSGSSGYGSTSSLPQQFPSNTPASAPSNSSYLPQQFPSNTSAPAPSSSSYASSSYASSSYAPQAPNTNQASNTPSYPIPNSYVSMMPQSSASAYSAYTAPNYNSQYNYYQQQPSTMPSTMPSTNSGYNPQVNSNYTPSIMQSVYNVNTNAQQNLWKCPACTFDNPMSASNCQVCGTRRP